jgi:hypothetical protein
MMYVVGISSLVFGIYCHYQDNCCMRAWREGVKEVSDTDMIARIGHCASIGLVLGIEKFRAQVDTLTA